MSTYPGSVPSSSPPPVSITEDRTVAIVSYLTLIGFIVAVVIHSSKKTAIGAYHLRQSLGLMLTGIAIAVCGMILAFVPYIGWMTTMVLWLGLLVLWVMGLISAAKGETKPVPVLGEQYQSWFKGAFN